MDLARPRVRGRDVPRVERLGGRSVRPGERAPGAADCIEGAPLELIERLGAGERLAGDARRFARRAARSVHQREAAERQRHALAEIGALDVELDEGAGELVRLPRRGLLAGTQAHDDIADADRLLARADAVDAGQQLFQFRLRLEREVGQLDFGDFAASADLEEQNVYGGNVDLEPEQRWISELTYERRFWGEGVVSIGYKLEF